MAESIVTCLDEDIELVATVVAVNFNYFGTDEEFPNEFVYADDDDDQGIFNLSNALGFLRIPHQMEARRQFNREDESLYRFEDGQIEHADANGIFTLESSEVLKGYQEGGESYITTLASREQRIRDLAEQLKEQTNPPRPPEDKISAMLNQYKLFDKLGIEIIDAAFAYLLDKMEIDALIQLPEDTKVTRNGFLLALAELWPADRVKPLQKTLAVILKHLDITHDLEIKVKLDTLMAETTNGMNPTP